MAYSRKAAKEAQGTSRRQVSTEVREYSACLRLRGRRDRPPPESLHALNGDVLIELSRQQLAVLPADTTGASRVNERDRIATAEEWERLKQAAAPHLRKILTILYALGPRKGEVLKLEWADVDFHRREFTLWHTKNGDTRVVPMTPEVYEVFIECRRERRLDTPRVFLYNSKPVQRLNTAFSAACRRAGITGLRIHDLRETASTNLRRAVVDTATAMKIVGHKSDRMHRRYNTIELADLHRAAAKLHAYTANTVITLGPQAVGIEIVSPQKISASGRSSVVES